MKRRFNNNNLPLEEALRRLTDDVDVWTGATLSFIPPIPEELTDEDSGDEDDARTTITNLSGKLLSCETEVVIDGYDPSTDEDEDGTVVQDGGEEDAGVGGELAGVPATVVSVTVSVTDLPLTDVSDTEAVSEKDENGEQEHIVLKVGKTQSNTPSCSHHSEQDPAVLQLSNSTRRTTRNITMLTKAAVQEATAKKRMIPVIKHEIKEEVVIKKQKVKDNKAKKKLQFKGRGKAKVTPRSKAKATPKSKADDKVKREPKVKAKVAEVIPDWSFERRDLDDKESQHIPYKMKENVSTDEDYTPIIFFEKFFHDQMIEMIVTETNRYAAQKGNLDFRVTPTEIKGFITILIVSSYVDVYSKDQYWSVDSDCRNEMVANIMPRNKFRDIMRYLHLCDNMQVDDNKDDRFFKVRGYCDLIRETCLKNFLKQNTFSIDETMVPYFGRHSLKQYIKGKPIKFGFKLWTLATHDGYVVDFIPYQGKTHQYDKEYGVGGSAVVELLQSLPPIDDDDDCGRAVYFDNLFTSFKLLRVLANKGIAASGTLRANRTNGAPLYNTDKADRGTYDMLVASHKDESNGSTLKIAVVGWKDKSTVRLASNKFGAEPLTTVDRYNKAEQKYNPVTCPDIVKHYNKGMGGVDLCDQNLSTYRIHIRKKVWWFKMFNHGLNLSLHNAYYLYKHSEAYKNRKLTFINFVRDITKVYAAKYTVRKTAMQLYQKSLSKVNQDIRFDGLHHYPDTNPTQRKCAFCALKVKVICIKCNVGLHVRCFAAFHKI